MMRESNNVNDKSAASTSVADDNTTTTVKDKVRQVLREEKVKLWNPPFVNDHGIPNENALNDLVVQWKNNALFGSSQEVN